jgi:NTE family protein
MMQFSVHGQKVGLVLSGGGARGMAHIGVIKALEENNIPIDYIAGSSAGAIIGCLYSLGYSPEQMDSIIQTTDFYNWATGIIEDDYTYYFKKNDENASWINLKFSIDSTLQTRLPTHLVNSIPLDFALLELTAALNAQTGYNFDSLFVPFRCVAADIETKQSVIFRKGILSDAVRASSAYPFYFRPISLNGKLLYDGGMYNNFPAEIALNEFQPDIIIGVNSAGANPETSEENVISHIRAMMTTPTSFSVICENSILIDVNTNEFGAFDFTQISEIVNAGYLQGLAQIEEIKFYTQRRIEKKVLDQRRKEFRAKANKIMIDHVVIEGISSKQADYVRQIVKPSYHAIPFEKFKSTYFQLVADPNVRFVYPTIKYNEVSKNYDVKLRIERENDLITQFGGNLSSRPVSEGFVGIQYKFWNRRSYSLLSNFYFGKLYTSGQLKIRMDSPTRIPYFLESDVTLNQYDFFRSSNAFFSDQKPAYVVKSDYNFGLNFGLPVRIKGRLITSASYIRIADNYYQTQNFLQKDTADKSVLKGFTGAIAFERSTLNRKQYANQGTFLQLKLRYVNINETTIPGSTSIIRETTKQHRDWYQFKLVYDNYYKRRGKLKLGFYAEASTTTMPFLSNYVSTVLNSPAFEPIQESQTLFLSNFHAHSYAGLGLKNVIMIMPNLDLRVEGFVFMPYKELVQTEDFGTEYGKAFSRRYYLGSLGAVYHSPIGPVSLFLNYYDDRENKFSVLFHVGFFIFNKSALD